MEPIKNEAFHLKTQLLEAEFADTLNLVSDYSKILDIQDIALICSKLCDINFIIREKKEKEDGTKTC